MLFNVIDIYFAARLTPDTCPVAIDHVVFSSEQGEVGVLPKRVLIGQLTTSAGYRPISVRFLEGVLWPRARSLRTLKRRQQQDMGQLHRAGTVVGPTL